MKKILIVLLIICMTLGCQTKEKETISIDEKSIQELESFKKLSFDDIISLNIKKYTVAGLNEETYTDRNTIKEIYDQLSHIEIGEETSMACEDNTTIYVFTTNNNQKYSFEFECEWLIVNNKRYLVK